MPQVKAANPKPASAARQLAGFIARYEPDVQRLTRAVRSALRKRFPTVNELAYEYATSVVISYTPSERGIEGIVALSADAKGVRLYFNNGASLPDPHGILLGNGRQTRFILLESAGVLDRPEVEALMTAAVRLAKPPLAKTGGGGLIIKTSSSEKKSRTRPAKRQAAARKA